MTHYMMYPLTKVAVRAAASAALAAAWLSAAPLSLAVAQTTGTATTTPSGRQTTGSAAGDNYGAADVSGNVRSSRRFITDAIQGNLAEVKLGQLAQQKSSNDQVRSFGMMLEKDHGAANDQAKQVAHAINVTAPHAPNDKQQATYDKLSKLSGSDFDKEFAKAMVDDHKKDIRKYELESKEKDAAGRYATQTLPKLKEHLKMAESIK